MAGLYFEEFTIGMKFNHAIRRTITEADNVFLTALTHNPAALHLDEEAMKKSEYGQRLVNSCLTLSFMVGISVGDTTLFHGDTIRIESEVLEIRESKSRPHNGIVIFAHRAYNQREELVGSCKRSALMLRKPK
jgi:acyl dehydratase